MERRTIGYHYPLGEKSVILSSFSLQRYPICGFAFLGVDKVGVDLGGGDALVCQHLWHRIDICAESDLERGEGVSEAVERDVFADAGGLHPGVERVLNHAAAQASEHQALLLDLAAEF